MIKSLKAHKKYFAAVNDVTMREGVSEEEDVVILSTNEQIKKKKKMKRNNH